MLLLETPLQILEVRGNTGAGHRTSKDPIAVVSPCLIVAYRLGSVHAGPSLRWR